MPAFGGNGMLGYNSADKKYWLIGFDNMGGWINLSGSDGMAFSGEGVPMGQKAPVKITFAKVSDKATSITLDFGGQVATESCKK